MGELFPNFVSIDIPRFYTAFAEWLSCLVFILILKPRITTRWKRILILIGMLLLQVTFLVLTDNVKIGFWIPCMIMAFFIMYIGLYFMCRVSFKEAAIYGMQAFVTAEFSASLHWQIVLYLDSIHFNNFFVGVLNVFIVYGGIEFIMYHVIRRHMPSDGRLDITLKNVLSSLMIAVSAFAISNVSFLSSKTLFSVQYAGDIGYIRTLVDLGGVAMLYAHFVQLTDMRARKELEAMENVLQNQYQQYKQSRESIDLIHYKYHDLKHQISVLRHEMDPEKRMEFLDQMEDEIRQYDLLNKTGNSVLDTILTGKSMYCDKHKITLTTVADGKFVGFMNVMDICSIFGNALDNAIECELKIPDKEKRLIHLSVAKQKQFLSIRCENYYEGGLKYKSGKLITTKSDKDFHGYGIKSIFYIAEKYGGAVSIDTKENWFDLKILIPIPVDFQPEEEQTT